MKQLVKESLNIIRNKGRILLSNIFLKKNLTLIENLITKILSPIHLKSKYSSKIFGIGLSRTGTKSLTLGLRELGYKSAHYPPLHRYYESININDAITDIPITCMYKKLDKIYPKSKFILTIRDMDSWLKSCEQHRKNVNKKNFKLKNLVRIKCYGTAGWNEKKYRESYLKHRNDVKEYFKKRPNDLLIIDIVRGEGYEKLCPFLGKPVLNKPFPHKNIAKDESE